MTRSRSAAALSIGLCACALTSPVAARQVIPAVAMPGAYQSVAISTPLAPGELSRWWRRFNDPALDALEDEAFRLSPDARDQAAKLLEARATRAGQIAGTWPNGSATGNASHQASYTIGAPFDDLNPTSGATDTATGNFNVSWELDLFGRLAARRRIARADDAEARFNVEGLRAALAADVADAYFQARGLVIQLDDARETLRIQNDLLAIARRRAQAGAGPEDEIDRVGGEVARSEAQVTDLEAQLDDQRRRLLILVGRDLSAVNDIDLTGDPPAVPETPASLPADLLTRRPDIREAEFRLRAELGTATLAHRAIFPTITLLPGLGVSSTSAPGVSYIPPSTLVTTQQVTTVGFWSVGAGISQPTLDIPRLLHEAKAQDARAQQAAVAYESTVRNAFGEAQNALADVAAGRKATARLDEGAARARRAYEASKRRYAQGLDDLTATLTAEQSWRSIHTALTSERIDTLRRAVRAYKALGGGWDDTGAGRVG